MKLQLDTKEKIIRIEGTVNLGELFNQLDNLFPNLEWREYSLEPVQTIINWISPITYPISPDYPDTHPWITYTDGGGFNVESPDPKYLSEVFNINIS